MAFVNYIENCLISYSIEVIYDYLRAPAQIEIKIDFDYILDENNLPNELFSNDSKFYFCFFHEMNTCGFLDLKNSTRR